MLNFVLATGGADPGVNWANMSATVAAIFVIYTIVKIGGKYLNNYWEERKLKRMEEKAGLTGAMLGGTNPAGSERSGAGIVPPEKQPVSNEICQARQRIITTKIDAVGEQVGKLDRSLADTNSELRKTTASLTEGVSKIETCVAVLEDRANRDG